MNATPGLSESILHPVAPNAGGPGSHCGTLAIYTDTNSVTDNRPCMGYAIAHDQSQVVWQPETPAYCTNGGDSGTDVCYEAQPGYYSTVTVSVPDCPIGYGIATTGSSDPYQYYTCVKS